MKRSFWAGILVAFALQSLVQDWMGEEAWIEHIRSQWWSPWITVPLALAMLILAGVLGALDSQQVTDPGHG